MLLLLGGAQLLLPGWLRMFVEAIRQYHHVHAEPVGAGCACSDRSQGGFWKCVQRALCAVCIWPVRREPATSQAFGRVFCLVLALTVMIVPMFAPYNQVLLVPAILALLQSEAARDPILPAIRLARVGRRRLAGRGRGSPQWD